MAESTNIMIKSKIKEKQNIFFTHNKTFLDILYKAI